MGCLVECGNQKAEQETIIERKLGGISGEAVTDGVEAGDNYCL